MIRAALAVLLFPAFVLLTLTCAVAVLVVGFVGSFVDGEW